MTELNLTIGEIIILQLGAIILGIAIHFFITSRKNLETSPTRNSKLQKQFEDWKMKYFNEAEIKEKELAETRMIMKETDANAKMYKAELELLKSRNEELEERLQQEGDLDDLAIKDEEIGILHQKLKLTEENKRGLLKDLDDLRERNRQLQNDLEAKVHQTNEHTLNESIEINQQFLLLQEQLETKVQEINNLHTEKKGMLSELEKLHQQNLALQSDIESIRNQNHGLQVQLENRQQETPSFSHTQDDYLSQLQAARLSLQEHSQKISDLIGQVDLVKQNEEKQQAILKENEELSLHMQEMQNLLQQKDAEINSIKEKEKLTVEMHSMLDNFQSEFLMMKDKMQKLESQVAASKMANMEFDDLKESHYKLTKDFEIQRAKLFAQISENQKLNAQANDLQENLNAANFHRQQLQKRVAYLEELNNDLHTLSEANKSLESRLKSIGELESRLNIMAEERDQLLRQQERHA